MLAISLRPSKVFTLLDESSTMLFRCHSLYNNFMASERYVCIRLLRNLNSSR